MSPEHEHTITLTARWLRWLRWPTMTTEWRKVCRCKEADDMATTIRREAESNPEARITVRCDVRGVR